MSAGFVLSWLQALLLSTSFVVSISFSTLDASIFKHRTDILHNFKRAENVRMREIYLCNFPASFFTSFYFLCEIKIKQLKTLYCYMNRVVHRAFFNNPYVIEFRNKNEAFASLLTVDFLLRSTCLWKIDGKQFPWESWRLPGSLEKFSSLKSAGIIKNHFRTRAQTRSCHNQVVPVLLFASLVMCRHKA